MIENKTKIYSYPRIHSYITIEDKVSPKEVGKVFHLLLPNDFFVDSAHLNQTYLELEKKFHVIDTRGTLIIGVWHGRFSTEKIPVRFMFLDDKDKPSVPSMKIASQLLEFSNRKITHYLLP